MSSSYSHAYAIKKTDILAPSYSYHSIVDSGEVTYENFNNHLESISDISKILEETSTHKYTNRYNPESAKYSIRMKVLNYFANYDYICNTELENKLREEQVIDTYGGMDSFGLVLDLGAADAILADLVTYNLKKFTDIQYDEELQFSEVYEEDCCNEYDVTSLNLNNVTDYNLRIILECDRKLHTDVYTNSNNYLLNSINMSIENQNSKNIKK